MLAFQRAPAAHINHEVKSYLQPENVIYSRDLTVVQIVQQSVLDVLPNDILLTYIPVAIIRRSIGYFPNTIFLPCIANTY